MTNPMPNPTQPRDIAKDRSQIAATLACPTGYTSIARTEELAQIGDHYLTRTASAEARVAKVEAILKAVEGWIHGALPTPPTGVPQKDLAGYRLAAEHLCDVIVLAKKGESR